MAALTANQQNQGSFLVLSRAIGEWRCGSVPVFVLVTGTLAAIFGPAPWSSIAGVLAALAALAFVVPGRLRVGADALTLSWLWTRRTVPLEEIKAVTPYQEHVSWVVGLRLDLRSGVLLVPMRSPIGMSQLYWFLPKRTWGSADIDLAVEAIAYAIEKHPHRLGPDQSGDSPARLP